MYMWDEDSKIRTESFLQAALESQHEEWHLKEKQMCHRAEELEEQVNKQEIQLYMLQTKLQETVQARPSSRCLLFSG